MLIVNVQIEARSYRVKNRIDRYLLGCDWSIRQTVVIGFVQ